MHFQTWQIEMADIIKFTFDVRSDSDYDDYYVISREDVLEQIENAEKFLEKIQVYLNNRMK